MVEDRLYIMIPKLSNAGCFSRDGANTIERVLPAPWVAKMVQSLEAFVGLPSENVDEMAEDSNIARMHGILNILTISMQTQNWNRLAHSLHARLTSELSGPFEGERKKTKLIVGFAFSAYTRLGAASQNPPDIDLWPLICSSSPHFTRIPSFFTALLDYVTRLAQ
jgi:hypothetical protein